MLQTRTIRLNALPIWCALSAALLGACSGSKSRDAEAGVGTTRDPAPSTADASSDASLDAGTNRETADAGTDGAIAADAEAGADDAQPHSDIYAAWQELRDGILREENLFLALHPDQLIPPATDAEALYRFVRDALANYPGAEREFGDLAVAARWGVRGTLRGGAGTAREKAEVLLDLYKRAGLRAELMVGPAALTDDDLRSILVHRPPSHASAGASDARLSELVERFGLQEENLAPPSPPFAPSAPNELAALITAAFKAGKVIPVPSFNYAPPQELPLVRVWVGDTSHFANPYIPHGEFGQSYVAGDPLPLTRVMEVPQVTISLRGTESDAALPARVLVERTWSAADLVGRRVLAGFTAQLTLERSLSEPAGGQNSLTPTLLVQGSDLSDDEAKALGAVGSTVTTHGAQVSVDPQGRPSVGGSPPLLYPDQNETLARIRSVNVTANAETFPQIKLYVSPLDSGGNLIPGLVGKSLLVTDEGDLVRPILTRNVSAPKILILLDKSGSVSPEYRGEGGVQFGLELVQRAQAQAPQATFRVASLGSPVPTYHGDWTHDPAQIESQLRAPGTTQSNIFRNCASAAKGSGADVILLVTDGDSNDSETEQVRTTLQAGPPIVAIGVGVLAANAATLPRIAELSEGAAFDPATRDAAVDMVVTFLGPERLAPYELVYDALRSDATTHTVQVQFANPALNASTTYEVPSVPKPADRLRGLQLVVRVGQREVTRTLAGVGPSATSERPLQDLMAEVFDAYGDVAVLSFEGAAPSLSHQRVDQLEALLSRRPLADAFAARDGDRILKAFEAGQRLSIPELDGLQFPMPRLNDGKGTLTFEESLDVVLFHSGVRRSGRQFITTDILPITAVRAVAQDSATGFAQTMLHSARRALVEAALFPESTHSVLLNETLRPAMRSSQLDNTIAELTPELQARWKHAAAPYLTKTEVRLVLPQDLSKVAFWAVDPTGHSLGIIESQAGGSTWEKVLDQLTSVENQVEQILKLSKAPSITHMYWKVQRTVLRELAGAALLFDQYVSTTGLNLVGNPADKYNLGQRLGCAFINNQLGQITSQLEYALRLNMINERYQKLTQQKLVDLSVPVPGC